MSEDVRKLVSCRIEEFQSQLEKEIKRVVGEDESVTVILSIDFKLEVNKRLRVLTNMPGISLEDLLAIDTSGVPEYKWTRWKRIRQTRRLVRLEEIAAGVQRCREWHPTLQAVLIAFARNGNTPLSHEEVIDLGGTASSLQQFRGQLRVSGLPFTIGIVSPMEKGSEEPSYKLFAIEPPRRS